MTTCIAETLSNFTNSSTGVGPLNANWNFSTTTGAPASTSTYNPGVSFNPALGGGSIVYSVKLFQFYKKWCSPPNCEFMTTLP